MRNLLLSVCIVSLTALPTVPEKQPVLIHNGFLTGDTYLRRSTLERRAYATGVVDGMFLSPLFGAPKDEMAWFESCVEGMTDEQVAQILYKSVKENPADWHRSVHTEMYRALKKGCPAVQE